MPYRLQIFKGGQKVLDLASNTPLPDAREEAVDAMNMLKGDYALIVDEAHQIIERLKCSLD
jgi:hypothetical protein